MYLDAWGLFKSRFFFLVFNLNASYGYVRVLLLWVCACVFFSFFGINI